MAPRNTRGLASYLSEIKGVRGPLSEGHLYGLFAEHVVKGVLGYEAGGYNFAQRGPRGTPDLSLRDSVGARWVEAEGKVDDGLIRRAESRQRLWQDKRKYVTAETVYFIWFAPRTILVCDIEGNVCAGVYMDDQAALELPLEPQIIVSRHPEEVRKHLYHVSAVAATEAAYLQDFAAGKVRGGYIAADEENLERLTHTLQGVTGLLDDFLTRRWRLLGAQHDEYAAKRKELDEWHQVQGDVIPARRKEVDRIRLRQEYEDAVELMETALPLFEQEQAYTRYQRATNEPVPEALRRIFIANATYVILGRLLFVRFAEDMGLIPKKISNGGLKMWRELVGHPEALAHKLIEIAFLDSRSLFTQLFRLTPFDSLLFDDDPEFNQVLYRVLYRLNAFDFTKLDRDVLGGLYQGILPRDKRKALGEFYTDPEVIEYILRRVGYAGAIEERRSTRLLDPACGSGAFLVAAAAMIREDAERRGVEPAAILSMVEDNVHGLDINHFAVFIAQMNLLFSLFDMVARAREPVRFQTEQANSLLRNAQAQRDMAGGEQGARQATSSLRERAYAFVVGNPPYVRHERLPGGDRESLRESYADVCRRNADLATFFLRRGPEWLEPDGALGMIVSRALADSGYAVPLREHLAGADLTIREIVPLDWCSHELFDSDVVPMLVFVKRSARPPEHTVRLVQGLRTRAELVECGRDAGQWARRCSAIPWEDFVALSEATWPLEVRSEDVALLRRLQAFDRLGTYAPTQYGVKVGAQGRVLPQPGKGLIPMLVGSDICTFGLGAPGRFVALESVDSPSIWRPLREETPGRAVPHSVVGVAGISITLNAAVIPAQQAAAQNTVLVACSDTWGEPDPYAAAALVANSTARYFSFLLLRGAVTGGGRRDYTIYPRTVEALPIPPLTDAQREGLAQLSERAHELGRIAARDQLLLWQELVASAKANRRVGSWGLDFSGWARGAELQADGFEAELTPDKRLVLRPSVTVRGDEDLLAYLALALEVALAGAGGMTRADVQRLEVPGPAEARAIMEAYAKALDEQEAAKQGYFAAVEEIDEAVMDAFGLSRGERELIRRRMGEFPLKEHAANFRVPWEQTRPPRLKHFEPGERFRA